MLLPQELQPLLMLLPHELQPPHDDTGALQAVQEPQLDTGALHVLQEPQLDTGAQQVLQEPQLDTGALQVLHEPQLDTGALHVLHAAVRLQWLIACGCCSDCAVMSSAALSARHAIVSASFSGVDKQHCSQRKQET